MSKNTYCASTKSKTSLQKNAPVNAGVKTFLYPKENNREFVEWKNIYKKEHPDITFIEISTIEQVFTHVFTNDNITV